MWPTYNPGTWCCQVEWLFRIQDVPYLRLFRCDMSIALFIRLYLYRCPQCTATHCNTLRHTATHFNTLQHTATHCNTLQHTATHCSTLQHTATHCNTLQHTATHCNTLQHTTTLCSTLQHSATHCNTLQHTAAHCNTLQHTFHKDQTTVKAHFGKKIDICEDSLWKWVGLFDTPNVSLFNTPKWAFTVVFCCKFSGELIFEKI